MRAPRALSLLSLSSLPVLLALASPPPPRALQIAPPTPPIQPFCTSSQPCLLYALPLTCAAYECPLCSASPCQCTASTDCALTFIGQSWSPYCVSGSCSVTAAAPAGGLLSSLSAGAIAGIAIVAIVAAAVAGVAAWYSLCGGRDTKEGKALGRLGASFSAFCGLEDDFDRGGGSRPSGARRTKRGGVVHLAALSAMVLLLVVGAALLLVTATSPGDPWVTAALTVQVLFVQSSANAVFFLNSYSLDSTLCTVLQLVGGSCAGAYSNVGDPSANVTLPQQAAMASALLVAAGALALAAALSACAVFSGLAGARIPVLGSTPVLHLLAWVAAAVAIAAPATWAGIPEWFYARFVAVAQDVQPAAGVGIVRIVVACIMLAAAAATATLVDCALVGLPGIGRPRGSCCLSCRTAPRWVPQQPRGGTGEPRAVEMPPAVRSATAAAADATLRMARA